MSVHAKKKSRFFGKKPDELMERLIRQAGSNNHEQATAAVHELATALTLPLQQGVLNGDIFSYIYEPIKFKPGAAVEFPLDWLAPGQEKNFIAYVIPRHGALPEKSIEGDFVTVPMYEIGMTLDWSKKYMRDARWDILGRALQVLEAGFIRKMNTDAWRVVLASAKSRNLLVYDDAATAGNFTKRLVALGNVYMRRNGGGNSTSTSRGKMTDLHISVEAESDMFSWTLSEVSDQVRTQIFLNGPVKRIGDVNIRTLDELGVGQEFDNYFLNQLGGSFTGSKVELAVGLDLSEDVGSFVMPYRQMPELYEDMRFAPARRVAIGGTAELGFSSCDSRRGLLLAL
jgi:hypothetical protein